MYRRTYRNYIDVLLHSIRNKDYPLRATLRNGVNISLNNGLETYMIAQGGSNVCDYKDGVVTISIHSCGLDNPLKVRLCGVTIESEAFSIFADKIYRYLPVRGRTVVDIGANIADSSIYFSLLGADKVIALEPLPNTYEIAKKNIELNNLSHKITLWLAGCAAERGSVTVDPAASGRVTSRLSENNLNSGVRVPLLDLDNILAENDVSSDSPSVLKMDCEGCEYDAILSSTENTLQKFSHMIIEYHYGYRDLRLKLKRSGFRTSVTLPRRSINDTRMRSGYIFADRH